MCAWILDFDLQGTGLYLKNFRDSVEKYFDFSSTMMDFVFINTGLCRGDVMWWETFSTQKEFCIIFPITLI